jgi:tetratricopeptide (TPR) repeat protein
MRTNFLSRFTPSLMPPEALEAIFVQRERLATRTVQQVRDSALTGPPSHTLFVGPRGIGKTHLVSLIYHRVKALPELEDRLAVAWLPEDEGGIATFLDLLLAVLRALGEDDPALMPRLAPRLDALYESASPEADAKALLRDLVGERSLLLMAENLDHIFTGLRDTGQKALRAFLQESGFVTMVVTAQSLFSGVARHASPFYGFFRVEHLSGLSIDEALELLVKIARREDDTDLVTFLGTPAGRARIRAVDHLVAGNPRLYVIFSEFLTRDALDELVPPFLDMLDNLTPFYQAKMRSLSPQQRKLVDFLSGTRGALPVKEIARRTLIGAATVSAQLKALRESGYVQAHSIGRESFYELREPLMRLCLEVKKQRGEPIKLFVEFLRLWCSPEELERRLSAKPAASSFSQACLREALQSSVHEAEVKFHEGVALSNLNHWKEALDKFEQSLLLEPRSVATLYNKSLALSHLDYIDEALAVCEQALKLDKEDADVWNSKGVILGRLNRWEEAFIAFEHSLTLDMESISAWHNKSTALENLDRHEDALAASNQSLRLDPQNVMALQNKGLIFDRLNRPIEALAAWEKAIALTPHNATLLNNKGVALFKLERLKEALTVYEQAIQLEPNQPSYHTNRIEALLALDRWDEGVTGLDNALPLFRDTPEALTLATIEFVQRLIKGDLNQWTARAEAFTTAYTTHGQDQSLGQALVQSVPALASPLLSPAARRLWYETWHSVTGDRPEFTLPLRLLDVAIRYQDSGDPPDARILLELPAEERSLLRPLVGVADESEDEE